MGKIVDTPAILQVLGCIYLNPSLLDFTDKYNLCKHDFVESFHRMIYKIMFQLHSLDNAKQLNAVVIEDYLSDKPEDFALFKKNDGEKWLAEIGKNAQPELFDFYYNRVKKLSLLRAYQNCGVDVSDIYDPEEVFDQKKINEQGEWLTNHSIADIVKLIDEKIDRVKAEYTGEEFQKPHQAGTGIKELLEHLKQNPDYGLPLYGSLINTVTRGARLGKFYLRSAPSGVGKSRTMMADAAYMSCSAMWEEGGGWITMGAKQPTLYITTEQRLDEVQTMLLSFIAGVDEDKILESRCDDEENERLAMAASIIAEAPLYIEEMPDFSMTDIENQIKRGIRDYDAHYIFLDYIHSSIKILEEITRRTGGIKLREDNVLFMIAIKIKDICVQNDVFILSSTQLSADWKTATEPDQNLLRGAKSIADKIDLGMHILPVSQDDLQALGPVIGSNDIPNLKLAIYKNRRGKYKSIFLWCKANLGQCKINPIFATTFHYELIQMNSVKPVTDTKKYQIWE